MLFHVPPKQSTTKNDAILYRYIVVVGGWDQDDPGPSCAWTQFLRICNIFNLVLSNHPTLLFSLEKLRFSSSFLCLRSAPKQQFSIFFTLFKNIALLF